MDIKCFIITLPTAFLKEAIVKKLKKEGMHFAPFVTEVVMEKLTFYAGLEDGKLLGHAPETTSLAFRHKTGSPTELQTIYFDYVIFKVLLRSWLMLYLTGFDPGFYILTYLLTSIIINNFLSP